MACPLRQRLPAPLQGHSMPHPHHAPPVPQTAARAEPCRRHRRFQSPCRHGHAAWVEDPPERVWGACLKSKLVYSVTSMCIPADAIACCEFAPKNSTPAQGGPAIDGAPLHAGAPYPTVTPVRVSSAHAPRFAPAIELSQPRTRTPLTVCVRSPLGRVPAAAAIVGQLATAHRRRLYHRPSPPLTRAGRACVHPTPSGDRRQQQ